MDVKAIRRAAVITLRRAICEPFPPGHMRIAWLGWAAHLAKSQAASSGPIVAKSSPKKSPPQGPRVVGEIVVQPAGEFPLGGPTGFGNGCPCGCNVADKLSGDSW
jgi:hypothetical protein